MIKVPSAHALQRAHRPFSLPTQDRVFPRARMSVRGERLSTAQTYGWRKSTNSTNRYVGVGYPGETRLTVRAKHPRKRRVLRCLSVGLAQNR